MISKWLALLILPLYSFPLFAQEEQEVIQHMEHSGSRERIIALSLYCDHNVFSRGRTREKLDLLLAAGYRIASRDNDKEFKDYLDFYSRMSELMFIPYNDMHQSELAVLEIWRKALDHYESKGEKRFQAICQAQIGESHFLLKQYSESIESLLKARALFDEVGYDQFPLIGRHLHYMALIFYFFREYDEVIELMNISIRLPPHESNMDIQRHNTLGAALLRLKQFAKAEEAFKTTIETAASYNDDLWVAIASGYLANCYIEQGRYPEALGLYESTLKYAEDKKDVYRKEYSEHLLGVAKVHILLNQLPQAQKYLEEINFKSIESTRTMHIFNKSHQDINYWLNYYDVLHRFYRASKKYDQAYFYSDSLYRFKYLIDSTFNRLEVEVVQNRMETQKEKYEREERDALVKTQNQLLAFFIVLVIVVVTSAVLLLLRNRKVRSQNLLINQQMESLQKILNQKQVLLKELQHRVKNNLQHVISILEIQKESVDFNNIEELVRENQNRIHSMALLHSKLDNMEEANMVNMKEYLTGLSGLVKDSYGSDGKEVELSLRCETDYLSIEKALPVGLITVELISNSIKHAFENRDRGTIHLALRRDDATKENVLDYTDDGKGFDFTVKNSKGLGLEIIRGLIDQLNGRVETHTAKGFCLRMYFQSEKQIA